MPDETHKLQKDPPEGSRKVIEQELEREFGNKGAKTSQSDGKVGSASERKPDQPANRDISR